MLHRCKTEDFLEPRAVVVEQRIGDVGGQELAFCGHSINFLMKGEIPYRNDLVRRQNHEHGDVHNEEPPQKPRTITHGRQTHEVHEVSHSFKRLR
jgi:hypothetical protein